MAVSCGPNAPRWNSAPRWRAPAPRRRSRTAAPGRARSRALAPARRRRGAVAQACGDRRPQHRRDDDGDDAERQLIKAVGVIEPRHRRWRRRRHHGAGHQLQLWDAARHHPWARLGEEPPQLRGQGEREAARPGVEPQPRGAHAGKLDRSGERHRGGEQRRRAGRRLCVRKDQCQHGADQDGVEHHDPGRRRHTRPSALSAEAATATAPDSAI